MTKFMTIFILLLNFKLSYAETKMQEKIQTLAKESSNIPKKLLLSKVLALRTDAMNELVEIINDGKYRVDDTIYLTDIDTTLDALPSKVEDFSSCENLKSQIVATFQREDWNSLPKAALDMWTILKNICK